MFPIAPGTAVPELNREANSFSTTTGETPKNSAGQRPMFYEFKPEETVRAAHGTTLRCKTWEAEAALRLLSRWASPATPPPCYRNC